MFMKDFIPTKPVLKEFTRRHKYRVIQLITLGLSLPIFEVLIIAAIYIILNGSIPESIASILPASNLLAFDPNSKIPLAILAIVCLIGIIIIAILKKYLAVITAKTTYDIYQNEVNQTAELYFNIPGWAHLKEKNDEVMNLVFNLSGNVAHYYVSLVKIVLNCLGMLILTIAALVNSINLTIVALFLGSITIIVNIRNFNKMKIIGNEKQETQQNVINELYQNILGFELIKFDNLQRSVMHKIQNVMKRDWNWRVQRRSTTATASVLSDSIGLIAILSLSVINTFWIDASISKLIVIILLLNRMRGYTNELQNNWLQMKESIPGVHKAIKAKDRFLHYADSNNPSLNQLTQIVCDNVSFGYNEKTILSNLNLALNPGEWVLLSGPSGEGKSTLLKLITGYYLPDSGSILFDQSNTSDVSGLNFNSIQDHMFYCNNDLYLPNTTLREAIDRNDGLNTSQIDSILSQTCLTELTESENYFSMMIGENASHLSEGQRQRLLLARLFLKQPKLVILDESTSNLDEKTEAKIFNNIKQHLSSDCIVIISAHKVPGFINFDKKFAMSNKKLAAI